MQIQGRFPLGPLGRRFGAAIAALFLVVIMGVGGYATIEGWGFLDALYMTVTTITTVGFREVQPLTNGGRIFTLVLIVSGVGVLFYTLTNLVAFVVEGELADLLGVRRLRGRIESLKDHYILCGFGRVGEEIVREFTDRHVPYIIVDSNPEAVERARQRGYLVMEGDATRDEVLKEAGLERARCLLAASDSDAGNTFIILAAKALRPDLLVVARAGQPESEARMLRAGADRIISPYIIAGRHMALSALQPLVVDFIDTLAVPRAGGQILAEIGISEESGLIGRTIAEVLRDCPGAIVLGLQKATGEVAVGPANNAILEPSDRLILLGNEAELEAIRPAVERRRAPQSRSP